MHLKIAGGCLAVALAFGAFAGTASAGVPLGGPIVQAKTAGTHNYKITIGGGSDSVTVAARKGGVSESYNHDGTTSGKKIKVDLGPYGSANLTFDQKRKTKKSRPKGCHGGKPDKTKRGVWEGKFKFKGQDAFTKANDSSLKGTVFIPGTYRCNGGPGGNNDGVSLNASKFSGGGFTSFSAFKRNPSSKASFSAFSSESGQGNVSISYFANARGGASTFDYTLPNDATVDPPGPFSGTATYDDGDWSGNLKVKYPSKAVNLAGAGFFATLNEID